MKKSMMSLAAAALLLAACTGNNGTTKVTATFDGDAPEKVKVMVGETEKAASVVDGKVTVEVPVNVTTVSRFQAGGARVSFISDGSKITIDPSSGTAVSSSRKGVHSRYVDYTKWTKDFTDEYRAKMATFGDDEEAAEAYYNETAAKYNDYQMKALKANKNNIIAALALPQVDVPDSKDMLALIATLSEEMQANPDVARMKAVSEVRERTGEGTPFVDFTVVQNPADPEGSTVSFSDYIGKGKYMLVDFWASWCGPCKEEIPNIANVYEKYHGDRFDVLSVAVWEKPDKSLDAAPGLGIVWNQIVNAQSVPTELYGIEGIPHIILFGPDGTILKRDLRGEEIEAAVKEALGQ